MSHLVIRLALIATLALSALGLPATTANWATASAQNTTSSQTAPDYQAWDLVANRAEKALADGRGSNAAFEALRKTLVGWRAEFQTAQDTNAKRIATAETQLTALGDAPEEGSAESAEITERRIELARQLADLRAPGLRAVEALQRATGLISEVDALISSRDTQRLLYLGPSPLGPANWAEAAGALGATLQETRQEFSLARQSDTQRQRFSENAPATLALLALAALLFLRAPRWITLVWQRVNLSQVSARVRLGELLRDLAILGAQVAAIIALAEALRLTTALGFRGVVLVDVLKLTAIAFIAARWLAPRLLPPGGPARLSKAIRGPAGWVALAWGGHRLLAEWSQFDNYPEAATSVLQYILVLVAALGLFYLAGIAGRAQAARQTNTENEPTFRDNLIRLTGWATRAVALIAPVAGAIGYGYASQALVFSTSLTLALLAALTVPMALIRDGYAVLRGKDDAGLQASLTPVLANLVLVIASLPLLALIWGVREARLADLWTRFGEGVRVGESQITPGDFLTFAIVFVVGYLITRALQSTLRNSVLPKTNIETGAQNSLTAGLGYVGIFAAAVIAISSAGIDLSSLAIVAGALSVGIGFGLQNIVSNFVSGIILLIERPISEGDWIEVGGQQGYVRDISVRSTRIETFDRSDVIVPNSDLVSGQVTNFTRGNSIGRVIVPVSVAYGTDTRTVEKILQEIGEAHPMVALNPKPSVVFQRFGADGLDFEIRAILRDVNWVLSVKSDMNHEIMKRFAEENIEIPYAQRDIWLRNADQIASLLTSKGEADT